MKEYQGRSITYSEITVLTKTTPVSTVETVTAVDTTPIYTVPTGRTAKIQYLTNAATGILTPTSGSDSGVNPTVYIKINNNQDNNSGKFLLDINAISPTAPMNIYLSSGDSLYVRYSYGFASSTNIGAGSTITIYPGIYISVIEEYEA